MTSESKKTLQKRVEDCVLARLHRDVVPEKSCLDSLECHIDTVPLGFTAVPRENSAMSEEAVLGWTGTVIIKPVPLFNGVDAAVCAASVQRSFRLYARKSDSTLQWLCDCDNALQAQGLVERLGEVFAMVTHKNFFRYEAQFQRLLASLKNITTKTQDPGLES